MLREKFERHFLIIYGIAALFLYSIVIVNQKPVDIDYHIVIEPLKQIDGIASFLKTSSTNRIVDIQPVRDISLKLDLVLENIFHVQFHGFFNAFLWCASGIVLFLILKALSLSNTIIYFSSLLFLVHPVAAWVVSWPSARKHLLALFFISLASYCSLLLKQKKLKYSSIIFLLYGLSVLSQPISLLWIFCFFFYFFDEIKKREHLALFYLLCGTFILVAGANYFYYQKVYEFVSGAPKMISQAEIDKALAIASISRSLAQIFYPINFSYDYLKSSIYTLLGLPTFTLFILLFAYKQGLKKSLFLALMILFPLILVHYKPTNIFVSDTYVIIPIFFSVLAIALILVTFNLKKSLLFFAPPLLAILTVINIREQYYTSNTYRYFKISYEREPSCRNTVPIALSELVANNLKSFEKIAKKATQETCIVHGGTSGFQTTRLYFYYLLLDKKISLKNKYKSSLEIKQLTPDIAMVQAILSYLVNGGAYKPVQEKIYQHISPEEQKFIQAIIEKACRIDTKCKSERLINFFNH